MHPTTSRTSLVRAGLIAAALSIGGAVVAYASLPPAAASGQARAEAAAANGQADEHQDEHAGQGATGVADRLAENQERLFSTLNDVLDRLAANDKVPDAAIDALQGVIDRLGGDIGLNRAMEAVGSSADHPDLPDLPDAATDHPGKP